MTSLTVPSSKRRAVPMISRVVPAADFPPLPTLSLEAFLPSAGPAVRSVVDAGEVVHVTAGRFAIALALSAMGLKPGEKVLIPAYHCTTMVEPLKYAAATPVFYKLTQDLSPDFEDIAAKIDPDTRALMVPHYFGFPQDMQRIRSFCDAAGIKLLEDCAHAYFGEVGGRPVGGFGDFAIASPTKFFPLNDGGCLINRSQGVVGPSLREQGARASLVASVREMQRAVYYGNLPAIRPFLALARAVRDALSPKRGKASPGQSNGTEENIGNDFDLTRVNVAMSGYSAWVYRNVARSRVVAKRRRNYALLIKELEGLEGCRPFFPDLPEGVVPYEVPFWIDDLERHFPRLEDLAVPMHRFGQFLHEDMPEGTCPLSESLSHHLVQFPCHQDLHKTDIVQIAARIRMVLSA